MARITKLVVTVTAACLLVVLSCLSAQADQYTLGESSQDVSFTGQGNGVVSVTFGACSFNSGTNQTTCTLSGSALTPNNSVTNYTLEEIFSGNGSSPVTAGPGNSGAFAINMNGATAQISFNGGTSWNPIDYAAWNDGSANPHANGTWDGGLAFDYTLHNITGSCTGLSSGMPCTLDDVAMTQGAQLKQTLSSGEFVNTPEPASLSLLGIGLLGLAFAFRRQLKASA
jgi:hypothetical protein